MTTEQNRQFAFIGLIITAILLSIFMVKHDSRVDQLSIKVDLIEAWQEDHQQLDKVELTVPQSRTVASTKHNEPETYQATITAYCPCAKCCGKFADGITASGLKAKTGMIAADKSIPFGTKVWIDGLGDFVVQDRGGAIKGKHFDVYCDTHQAALEIGRSVRKVKVYKKETE